MNPKWMHAVLNGRTFNKIGINSDSVAKQHRNIIIMSIDDISVGRGDSSHLVTRGDSSHSPF